MTNEKFEQLLKIKSLREKEPFSSAHRKAHVCSQIPTKLTKGMGYHRKCYQLFTNKLHLLKETPTIPSSSADNIQSDNSDSEGMLQETEFLATPSMSKSAPRIHDTDDVSSGDEIISTTEPSVKTVKKSLNFEDKCIFCESSSVVYVKGNKQQKLSLMQSKTIETLHTKATERNDGDMLAKLPATSTDTDERSSFQYHRKCWKTYFNDKHWRSKNEGMCDLLSLKHG